MIFWYLGRSKCRPDVRKNEDKTFEFEVQGGLPEHLVEAKNIF